MDRGAWQVALHRVAQLKGLSTHTVSSVQSLNCALLFVTAWAVTWPASLSISNSWSYRMDWLDLLAVQGTLKSLLHHSSKASILQCSAFFKSNSHPYMTTGKTIALTRWTFVGKVKSLLFSMLSRLVITFLPNRKYFFTFMAAVTICSDFGDHQKSLTVSTVSQSICHEVMGLDAMILVF